MECMVTVIHPVDSNALLAILQESRESIKEVLTESPQWKEPIEKIIIPMLNILAASVIQLPTVSTFCDKETIGHWEPTKGSIKNKCSICQGETYDGKPPFCSHCGAAMKEKQDVLARLQ